MSRRRARAGADYSPNRARAPEILVSLSHLGAADPGETGIEPPPRCMGAHLVGTIEPAGDAPGARIMSKGLDKRKETKKKPAKTLEEKRAEKKAKRAARGY